MKTLPSILERVGYNITVLRAARGLTQEALADAAGVSRSTICNIENGTYGTTVPRLWQIAEALGCDVSDIFIGRSRGYRAVLPPESFSAEDEAQADYSDNPLVSALRVGDLCERYSIKRGWVPVVVTKEMLPVISQNPDEFRFASKENQEIRDLLAASEAPSTAKLIDLLTKAHKMLLASLDEDADFIDTEDVQSLCAKIDKVLPVKNNL